MLSSFFLVVFNPLQAGFHHSWTRYESSLGSSDQVRTWVIVPRKVLCNLAQGCGPPNGARTSCPPACKALRLCWEDSMGWFALRAQADRMSALRRHHFQRLYLPPLLLAMTRLI